MDVSDISLATAGHQEVGQKEKGQDLKEEELTKVSLASMIHRFGAHRGVMSHVNVLFPMDQ